MNRACFAGPIVAATLFAAQAGASEARDCADLCPKMVTVAGGEFAMGTPPAEEDRAAPIDAFTGQAVPLQTIAIKGFALGKYEVTRDEFAAFVKDAGYRADGKCSGTEDSDRGEEKVSWADPGYPVTGRHPVACINRDDAHAYAAWLSRKTGHRYRLPSEAEWEYAARANTATRNYWGDDIAHVCDYANVADVSLMRAEKHASALLFNALCRDGFAYTAPVGSFKPNAFGLYDMIGNVSELVEDCWEDHNAEIPPDGSPYKLKGCGEATHRGASFDDAPRFLASAWRYAFDTEYRFTSLGFRVAREFEPGETAAALRDCSDTCPEMVAIPAGHFAMGIAEGEEVRDNLSESFRGYSIPQRRVGVAPFAIAETDVTRDQFAAFAHDTHYKADDGCWGGDGKNGVEKRADLSWENPGFAQTGTDPVVCVSWKDAQAYLAWLKAKTKLDYRLPSEAEWEFAARAGTVTSRPWGDGRDEACSYANVYDRALLEKSALKPDGDNHFACSDGYAHTSPVGALKPDAHGLHDMLGNVWQWTQDCWNDSYDIAPFDGRAWLEGNCSAHPRRGGAWSSEPALVRSAMRMWEGAEVRLNDTGFRVARSLSQTPPPPDDVRHVVLVRARLMHQYFLRDLDSSPDPNTVTIGGWNRVHLKVSAVLLGSLEQRDLDVTLPMTSEYDIDNPDHAPVQLMVWLDVRSGGRVRALTWGKDDGVCIDDQTAKDYGVLEAVRDLRRRYPCPN